MDDMGALRRYYVASKLMAQMSGTGAGEYGSYTPDQRPPPPAAPSRSRKRRGGGRNADSYSFPTG